MKLLTKELEEKLLKGGSVNMKPICKFFNPAGCQTWLLTGLDPDGDTLWGYADLGFGCVEFGTMSLKEFKFLELPFGLKIERDLHFNGVEQTPEELLKLESLSGI